MSKIIVVSDSHGKKEELKQIYQHYKNEAKYFVHCGDSELSQLDPLFKIYHSVRGNCDDHSHQDEQLVECDGHKILIIHGHQYHVKFSLKRLFYRAMECGADIVCFGHTHHPLMIKKEHITFINPGSLLANRRYKANSFAVIDLDDVIKVTHINLNTFKEFEF